MTRERLRAVISTPGHFPDPSLVLSALCAIQMGISRRSTLVLVTQSRRLFNNEGAIAGFLEDLALDIFHGFVRSPEGTSTVFDPQFCFPGSTITGSILDKGSGSMNDKGVIVGACSLLTPPFPTVGWVRFP